LPHTGFIYHHPIVQSLQPDLRRKAARLIAAKCTLAARIDSIHSSMAGRIGEQLMQEVKLKLEKMQEPPPVKNRKVFFFYFFYKIPPLQFSMKFFCFKY